MKYFYPALLTLILFGCQGPQNTDPYATEIITTDVDHFWEAFDKAKPDFNPDIFEKLYLDRASDGMDGFMSGRIQNAENLVKVIKAHIKYYSSLKASTDSLSMFKDKIRQSLAKLKDYYPEAVFPPVYFVIGVLNSGGTSSSDGLIIGADMYGLKPNMPTDELSDWLKTVIKPVRLIPHIVAHELIHFQQNYYTYSLLDVSIKEGSADFLAELISGKHINGHVHEWANPRERELWMEFKERMYKKDLKGWLYSSTKGRPNDLGYWIGYKITKAYFDKMPDKKQAVYNILNIESTRKFLDDSGYAKKFH